MFHRLTCLDFSLQSQLDGRAGLESWRWLFIIEGLLPIVMALPVYFLLLTFPETSTALSDRGKDFTQPPID